LKPNNHISPRVFVSSVMDGFTIERQAVREGLLEAGCSPVLVEDFPSLSCSSRNACLDGVKSCDYIALIIGERGGWRAPSGKLVVEEEFDYATENGIPARLFIAESKRDPDAEQLARRLSDFIDGLFRTTFADVESLKNAVRLSFEAAALNRRGSSTVRTKANDLLKAERRITSEVALRLVVASIRNEDLIDPLFFDDPQFRKQLQMMAYDLDLFSLNHGSKVDSTLEHFLLQEQNSDKYHGTVSAVIEITLPSFVALEVPVTGLSENQTSHDSTFWYEILEADIAKQLQKQFQFATAFLDNFDKFRRHDSLEWNATLMGMGHRNIVTTRTPPRNAISLGQGPDRLDAFDEFRPITRDALPNGLVTEAERAIQFLKRRNKKPSR
jgi:Domain of unknown function (DUF4062)